MPAATWSLFELRARVARRRCSRSARYVVREAAKRPVSALYRLRSGREAIAIEFFDWTERGAAYARRVDPQRPAAQGGRERGRPCSSSRSGRFRRRSSISRTPPPAERSMPPRDCSAPQLAESRTTGEAIAGSPTRSPRASRSTAVARSRSRSAVRATWIDRPSHRAQAESALAEVEDRDDRNLGRARQRGRADRERRADGRTPGPRCDSTAGPRPISLERHDVAGAQRLHQLEAQRRVVVGEVGHVVAPDRDTISSHELLRARIELLLAHDVDASLGVAGSEPHRVLPRSDVRGDDHHAAAAGDGAAPVLLALEHGAGSARAWRGSDSARPGTSRRRPSCASASPPRRQARRDRAPARGSRRSRRGCARNASRRSTRVNTGP